MILKKINGTLIRKCKVNDQYRIFAPIPTARTTAAQAAASKPHHQSPCHTQNRAHSSKIDHIVAKLIPLAAPSPYADQPNAAAKLIPLSAPADLLVGSACWLGREGTRQRGWSFGAGSRRRRRWLGREGTRQRGWSFGARTGKRPRIAGAGRHGAHQQLEQVDGRR